MNSQFRLSIFFSSSHFLFSFQFILSIFFSSFHTFHFLFKTQTYLGTVFLSQQSTQSGLSWEWRPQDGQFARWSGLGRKKVGTGILQKLLHCVGAWQTVHLVQKAAEQKISAFQTKICDECIQSLVRKATEQKHAFSVCNNTKTVCQATNLPSLSAVLCRVELQPMAWYSITPAHTCTMQNTHTCIHTLSLSHSLTHTWTHTHQHHPVP